MYQYSDISPRRILRDGKRYKLMTLDEALEGYNLRTARGGKPAIIKVQGGYIIAEAIFTKEGGENDG